MIQTKSIISFAYLTSRYFVFIFVVLSSCRHEDASSLSDKQIFSKSDNVEADTHSSLDNTVMNRIMTPKLYERKLLPVGSFQAYLRNLKLKPEGSPVKYYNGDTKPNANVYHSVIDMKIGKKDLHQCADAVMRLRAEYFWHRKEYDKIHFNFTNGFRVDFIEWMKGRRIVVDGNRTYWDNGNNSSNTYENFWDYLELIFMYAGTASLEKELLSVHINEADIGDVLIQGGHPGHAVIIIDKAINETGAKIYLLAQSYMPAQELHILKNPNDAKINPWYNLENRDILTPEWTFSDKDLKRFID